MFSLSPPKAASQAPGPVTVGSHADSQAIVVALAIWVLMLGVLGLAPLPELPLNDKALHFFGVSVPCAADSSWTFLAMSSS